MCVCKLNLSLKTDISKQAGLDQSKESVKFTQVKQKRHSECENSKRHQQVKSTWTSGVKKNDFFLQWPRFPCQTCGMCVNPSQALSGSSSLLSLSLPSLLTPPELDNENNEFGVCFFLRVSPSPTSLFISHGPYLSHRDPRVTLFRPRHPPPHTFIFLLSPSHVL